MLSNAYFLAEFRFDTAENEPAKKMQNFKFSKIWQLNSFDNFANEGHGGALRVLRRVPFCFERPPPCRGGSPENAALRMTSVAGVAAPMAGWSGTKDWAIALLRVPSASLTFHISPAISRRLCGQEGAVYRP